MEYRAGNGEVVPYIRKFDREGEFRNFDAVYRAVGRSLKKKAIREICALSAVPMSPPCWVHVEEVSAAGRRKGTTRKDAMADGRALRQAHLDWESSRDWCRRTRKAERGERSRLQFDGPGTKKKIRNTEQIRKHLEYCRMRAIQSRFDVFSHGDIIVSWGALPLSDADQDHAAMVKVEAKKDWSIYAKSVKYPATVYTVTIRAQKLLKADMPGQLNPKLIGGNRDIDGLITLAAKQIPSPDGQTRAWEASWARRSTGVSWNVIDGFIVESAEGEVVHGKTLRTAMSTLKSRQTRSQRTAAFKMGMNVPEIIEEYGERRLNWRIARRAGLCADGITSWVMSHFPELDPRKDSITVKQALETRSSEALVLRAVEAAVSR